MAENTVLPLVSLALHTIPKVHFSVLFESKHQKTLFTVTYLRQSRVGGIVQISTDIKKIKFLPQCVMCIIDTSAGGTHRALGIYPEMLANPHKRTCGHYEKPPGELWLSYWGGRNVEE